MRRLKALALLACGLGGLWVGASLGGAGIGLPTITVPTLPITLPTVTTVGLPPPPPPPGPPGPPAPPPPPGPPAPPPPPPPPAAPPAPPPPPGPPAPPPPPAPQQQPPPPPPAAQAAPDNSQVARPLAQTRSRSKAPARRTTPHPGQMVARAHAIAPAISTRRPAPKTTQLRSVSFSPMPASHPHGVLSTASLAPSARKLPFLAMGLVALAIVLLALGALPAGAARNPFAASLLGFRRRELAFGGLAILAASIAAYLLI